MERELVVGRILKEFLEREEDIARRDLEIPVKEGLRKAVTIVGPRRSGKTYFLRYHFQRLRGVPKMFFPLDDDRIYPPALADLDLAFKVMKEMYPEGGRPYVFLDEVQVVPHWELFVNRLVEREGANVFVSGSSSRLLSKEIATELRGRTISYELFPFSFVELVRLKGMHLGKYLTAEEESRLKSLVKEYLQFGGFPEAVLKDEKRKILEEYADVLFYRDFVERHGIKNVKVARVFFNFLFASFAKEISVNRIFNFIKSQGIRTSRNTLYNYLEYLHDAYLVFPLRKFSPSLRESEQSVPKLYAVDNGLAGVFNSAVSENYGRLMENCVFMEMRKRGLVENKDVFYYKTPDGREVDFVVCGGSRVRQLVQVCYDLSDLSTKEREVRSLVSASESLSCGNLLVITVAYAGEEKIGGKKIIYVPLWTWLLGETR